MNTNAQYFRHFTCMVFLNRHILQSVYPISYFGKPTLCKFLTNNKELTHHKTFYHFDIRIVIVQTWWPLCQSRDSYISPQSSLCDEQDETT